MPKKNHWQIHDDLIIFRRAFYLSHSFEVLEKIAQEKKCSRIAILDVISKDGFRTPKIELVKGTETRITHVDNKIKYTFDITKCMFSFGNINEKLRISRMNCEGETVVDLFAGIGYFTLPLLVHGKASKVYACDWNPDAIKALEDNLRINNVYDRCEVRQGDCRNVCPVNVADRVILGLIPSSRIGWEIACKAVRTGTGGILHLHENVSTFGIKDKLSKKEVWFKSGCNIASEVAEVFNKVTSSRWQVTVASVNRVKSYAPHIDHLVFDLNCRPTETSFSKSINLS